MGTSSSTDQLNSFNEIVESPIPSELLYLPISLPKNAIGVLQKPQGLSQLLWPTELPEGRGLRVLGSESHDSCMHLGEIPHQRVLTRHLFPLCQGGAHGE